MTERASTPPQISAIPTAEPGRSSRTWRNHACADHSSSRANMQLLEASSFMLGFNLRSLLGKVVSEP